MMHEIEMLCRHMSGLHAVFIIANTVLFVFVIWAHGKAMNEVKRIIC